ncbi:MAG: hypothetical protein WCD81_10140 [Candidatus Bathyarchaeia archaeon]
MNFGGISRRRREGLLSAVSAGFFLLLIGVLFVIKPNLYADTVTFFNNFNATSAVPNTQIQLPAPDAQRSATNSTVHEANLAVYSAAQQFSVAWGIFLIALLVMRFAFDSTWRRKAQNISNIVFWFGAIYLIQTWLIDPTNSLPYPTNAQPWFEFWSMIIVLIGASLIVRAICLAAYRREYA